jgi:hypothetical protein
MTESESIKWEKTRDGDFEYSNGIATFVITYFTNYDEETSYYLFRLISSEPDIEDGFSVSQYEEDWETMKRLYGAASANAQNVAEGLEELFNQIRKEIIYKNIKEGSDITIILKNNTELKTKFARFEDHILYYYTEKGYLELFDPKIIKTDEGKKRKEKLLKMDFEAKIKEGIMKSIDGRQISDIKHD